MTRFTEFRSDFFTASMGRRIPVGSLVTCLRITSAAFLMDNHNELPRLWSFPRSNSQWDDGRTRAANGKSPVST
jgi:hypothetical protein